VTKNKLFEFDKDFDAEIIIGTDEAGRGPGAGGVFASAVYFPNLDKKLIKKLANLNDSKKLSKKKREELYEIIFENTINSTVCIEVEEIEKINILNASLKAMRLAIENVVNQMQSRVGLLSHQHETNILILVDGNKLIKFLHASRFTPHVNINQRAVIKGDAQSASIAAASILAKVSRDRYMAELHEKFPQYNWKQNAGYLTREHLSAIDKYGVTPIHRKSFLKKHEGEKCTQQLSLYQK
jgi:ribonuclease HII